MSRNELSNSQVNSLLRLSEIKYGQSISPLGLHYAAILYAKCNMRDMVAVVNGRCDNKSPYYIRKYYTNFNTCLHSLIIGHFIKPERELGDLIVSPYCKELYFWWVNHHIGCYGQLVDEFDNQLGNQLNAQLGKHLRDNPSRQTNNQSVSESGKQTNEKSKLSSLNTIQINKSINVVSCLKAKLKYKFKFRETYYTNSKSHKKKINMLSGSLRTSCVQTETYQGIVICCDIGRLYLIGQVAGSGVTAEALLRTNGLIISIVEEISKTPAELKYVQFPPFRSEVKFSSWSELFLLWSLCLYEPFKIDQPHKVNINCCFSLTVDGEYDENSHFKQESEELKSSEYVIFNKPFVAALKDYSGRWLNITLADC